MLEQLQKDPVFARYPDSTLSKFQRFHERNPHVYERFKEMAAAIRTTGRKKYSAKMIINALRWQLDLETASVDQYKINDRFQSIYPRLLILECPDFEGFFDFRERY